MVSINTVQESLGRLNLYAVLNLCDALCTLWWARLLEEGFLGRPRPFFGAAIDGAAESLPPSRSFAPPPSMF